MSTTTPVEVAQDPTSRFVLLARDYWITALIALAVVLVATDNGGYGESTRDGLAIALWWMLILGIGFGLWPLARVPLEAYVLGGLLAAFGLCTLLSVFWAADVGAAYAEFTRVALYLAVFAFAVAASRRDGVGRWCDGLAIGIVVVAILALISRFFPSTFEDDEIIRLLPAGMNRLSFPLGYWNGLAIFMALGIPLLLRSALTARNLLVKALAIAPVPALAGVIYMTSSRSGTAGAVIGAAAFVALADRRWTALLAASVAALGALVTVLAIYDRDALVNGPLQSSLAESQGRSAALIVACVCAVTGLVYAAALRIAPKERWVPPVVGWGAVAVAVALFAVAVAVANPGRRFDEFKQPPQVFDTRSAVESHLLSGGGNGRWQLWQSAWSEFENEPFHGRGAGSFGAWWARHASITGFVQDAHSLYLEVLGELGLVGFLLLVAVLGGGLGIAVKRVLSARAEHRTTVAALTATLLVYLVTAAVDWMWELTVVSVVAFVSLGLLAGAATEPAPAPRAVRSYEAPQGRSASRGRYGVGVATIVLGWLLICATAIPLLAEAKLNDSRAAAGRGDLEAATNAALAAHAIQPWNAATEQQLALVAEQAGDYDDGLRWIKNAIERNPDDWQSWLIRARLETVTGHIGRGARSYDRARALSPRSPVFANV